MYLNSTTSLSLRVDTLTPDLDVTGGYIDHSTPVFVPIVQHITADGPAVVVDVSAVGVDREVTSLSIVNKAAVPVTLQPMIGSVTPRAAFPLTTLAAGEALVYSDRAGGWSIITAYGTARQAVGSSVVELVQTVVYKSGSAPEAAGQIYSFDKDGGNPGAWTLGTPGMGGRACVGFLSSEAGAIPIPNPAVGTKYLTALAASSSTACMIVLLDYLVVTSGVVVTQTTDQTVNTVTLPARDALGRTEGHGVIPAIRVQTATTNASAITNITCRYTNQDGVPNRIGTIASFPATAVAGTVVPFRLEAGDRGARSVEILNLRTSLGGGAVGLVLYRQLALHGSPVANSGALLPSPQGARLYDGTCAHLSVIATATTPMNVFVSLTMEVRV